MKRQPKIERANDPLLRDFRAALEDMTGELARMIVRDGAKKGRLLTCDVIGAVSQRAARGHRPLDCRFDFGPCRHRGRGTARGTDCDGGRQGRRAGRTRPA